MQPAIPLGTVLQNRYRLLDILGQGGFGRTYLAEDQGRFNERCALKEFIPPTTETYAFEKSKELFRREAQVLYQIKHPQIPQFCAVFEENQRLFLVQDYVEGKTYHTLLNERKNAPPGFPTTFSEVEVLQFLRQILPILDYIHSLGIIHRDISPDNIILRQRDQIPVLIDFGVVNALATQIHSAQGTLPPVTRVGKLGYAPLEQLQTGKVSPSSDLYALGVTTIVLLTGHEPHHLLDQTTLTWNWQQAVVVRPAFAQIINRMLSRQPGDRYQSAAELERALQNLDPPTPKTAGTPGTPAPNLSEMKTVAVGHLASLSTPASPNANSNNNNSNNSPTIPTTAPKSLWENPWVIVTTGMVVALLTGWGSVALIRGLLTDDQGKSEQTPEVVISPNPTLSPRPTRPGSTVIPPREPIRPTPTPEATPSPQPTPTTDSSGRRLDVYPGEPVVIEGLLQGGTRTSYVVSAEAQEQLYVVVSGDGVLLNVYDPDENPVDSGSQEVSSWQGTVPVSGDYTIELQTVPGLAETSYNLEVHLVNTLPPLLPEPEPEPTFEPIPEPEPTFEPIPEPEPTFEPIPEPEPTFEPIPEPEPTPEPKPEPEPTPEPTPPPEPTLKPKPK
ncbi:serine/threonine-protein kinase, partial [Limnoraphis robusta Tam1]|uniref:serine/threonine-protein kinase n=1 Tax=Limnoraphis robusta TaxID=1118279 RepID=UPI002B205B8D